MNTRKNALTISRKNNMFKNKRLKDKNKSKIKKTKTKLSKWFEKEVKNNKNAIMTTLLNQHIQYKSQSVIMYGFIMFVQFGFLNVISSKRMESSA
jgi:hypothetical protein